MKKLSKTQTYIFLFGALMMVIGAGLNMVTDIFLSIDVSSTRELFHKIGACIFLLGSLCFAPLQMIQIYTGDNFAIKRLRTIQVVGDICFIVAGLFLFENAFRLLIPLFGSYAEYTYYFNNNWVVFLLIAATLEVYTTHRISYELNKENK